MKDEYVAHKQLIVLMLLAATTTGAFAQSHPKEDNSNKLTIAEVVDEQRRAIENLDHLLAETAKSLSDLINTQGKAIRASDKLNWDMLDRLTKRVDDLELRLDALEQEIRQKK
jgi:hypothetical protein